MFIYRKSIHEDCERNSLVDDTSNMFSFWIATGSDSSSVLSNLIIKDACKARLIVYTVGYIIIYIIIYTIVYMIVYNIVYMIVYMIVYICLNRIDGPRLFRSNRWTHVLGFSDNGTQTK